MSRDAATTITGAVINGETLNAAGKAVIFPTGTTFLVGELFLFAATDKVTSITVGAGSITAIKS